MPKLVLSRGNGKPTALELSSKTATLGRSLDCDVIVMHNMVSRRHAEIQACDGGWQVVDLDSANRVFVNDQEVKVHKLQHGDRVRLGQEVTFSYQDLAAAQRATQRKPNVTLDHSPASPLSPMSLVSSVTTLRPEFAAPQDSRTMLGLVSGFRDRKKQQQPDSTQGFRKESFHFFVLFQLARLIAIHTTTGKLDQLLHRALELLGESLQASCGAILLIDAETQGLSPHASYDRRPGADGDVKVSQTIARKVIDEKVGVLTQDAQNDQRFMHGQSIAALRIRSAVCCPIWDETDVDGVIYLVASDATRFEKADMELVTAVGNQLAVAIRQEELKQRLQREAAMRSNLERYHSPEVVDLIMRHGSEYFAVKETDVTTLFADIEGFTPLSNRLPPAEVAHILNGYFEGTTEAIFRHNGQVNKYIGDAIMAVFGAPIPNPNQAEDAVRAALDMLVALEEFSLTLPPTERFRIRIAINSGSAVAGNIGAARRLEYTVIGNSVNVAARLEKCAPPNGIAIGPETARRVWGKFRMHSLGPQALKGVAEPIEVYVVDGLA